MTHIEPYRTHTWQMTILWPKYNTTEWTNMAVTHFWTGFSLFPLQTRGDESPAAWAWPGVKHPEHGPCHQLPSKNQCFSMRVLKNVIWNLINYIYIYISGKKQLLLFFEKEIPAIHLEIWSKRQGMPCVATLCIPDEDGVVSTHF